MAVELVEAALRRARDHRDEPAIVMHDERARSISWGEIAERAAALAAHLDAATSRDATIATGVRCVADAWIATLATFATGRGFLPLPGRVNNAERTALQRAASDLAFVDIDAPTCGAAALSASRASTARLRLRTSGSTGLPRLVEREARAVDNVARTLVATLGVRAGEQIISFLPPHHSYGVEHAVLLPMRAGMTVVSAAQFSPATLHAMFESSAAATWPTTPSMLEAMASMPPQRPPQRAYTAGARSVPSVLERFIDAWGIVPGDLYGASEVGTIAFAADARDALNSVDGVEVRIDGGEICVRSDAMFSRYLPHDPTALRDGFFATGDLGHFDGDGVRIDGRLKLQFDVGGLKVNPIEVELHLLAHAAVREAVVVPRRMSESVTRAHAIIVPRGADVEIDVDAMRSAMRERVPAHMVPRTFEVRDALPKTPTGKVDRRALTEPTP